MDLTQSSYARYTAAAIFLHWAIALLIVAQIAGGLWMEDAIEAADPDTKQLAYQVIQIHKALGLSVLALSLLRLVWRLWRPAPPLPREMGAFERFAAGAAHVLLYGFMIAAPLTGWLMVSTSPQFASLPTSFFGLFTIPHLPVEALGQPVAELARAASRPAHGLLSWLGLALLALHVLAALKHHFIDQDSVLARMTPGVAPRKPVFEPPAPRPTALGVGLGGGLLLASLAAGAALFALEAPVGGAGAPARQAAAEGAAPLWRPVMAESEIKFESAHLGSSFSGVFESWSAEIRFDPERLAESRAEVVVSTASAVTGDGQFDGALPQADWFDVANHPEAVFKVVAFTEAEGGGSYVAEADLTLKGVTKRVSLPFALSIDGKRAEMRGRITLNRLDFEIGRGSDAAGDYVALEVPIDVTVIAERSDDGA